MLRLAVDEKTLNGIRSGYLATIYKKSEEKLTERIDKKKYSKIKLSCGKKTITAELIAIDTMDEPTEVDAGKYTEANSYAFHIGKIFDCVGI